jgi:uncharacterized protein YjbI with pentapeptide repeats
MRPRDRRRLFGKEFTDEIVRGDFRCAVAYNCKFNNIRFVECQMGSANFRGSSFVGCVFENCRLDQADLRASFKDCVFDGCTLDMASFCGAVLVGTRFSGGRAEYANFSFALLQDVVFDCQLHGADLTFDQAFNVDYGDSNVWGAKITVSCAQFAGAKLSERQLKLFAGLLGQTVGNDDIREVLRSIPDEVTARVLKVLTQRAVA